MTNPIPYKTLEQAIEIWNFNHPSQQIVEKQYKTVAELKAAGIGRTIFASYNEAWGWRLKQLGWGNRFFAWVARIFRWIGLTHQDTVLQPQQKLDFVAVLVEDSLKASWEYLRATHEKAIAAYIERRKYSEESYRLVKTPVSEEQFPETQKRKFEAIALVDKFGELERTLKEECRKLILEKLDVEALTNWLKVRV